MKNTKKEMRIHFKKITGERESSTLSKKKKSCQGTIINKDTWIYDRGDLQVHIVCVCKHLS